MKRLTQVEIDQLRATTAHADLEDFVAEVEGDDLILFNEELKAYLNRFAKPVKPHRPCLACGEHVGGFVWGLVHGHGHCNNCGWPATLYHVVKDRDGNVLVTVRGVLLQAHPDQVSVRV